MFVIYIQTTSDRAVYFAEFNDILTCREAMIELAEKGKRVHFTSGYAGPEIKTF